MPPTLDDNIIHLTSSIWHIREKSLGGEGQRERGNGLILGISFDPLSLECLCRFGCKRPNVPNIKGLPFTRQGLHPRGVKNNRTNVRCGKEVKNITKVEFRELQRNVSYLRRLAEELVDECCSFEADVTDLYEKGKHRAKPRRYAPLTIKADVTDEELDECTPEMRMLLGYSPEPANGDNCA